ncbi:MAG: GGDEF domain-containing protein, partial [Clostridiales bacterium]|nr:GGDEF domain-containing protein [Clostridiales bacterium]
MKNSETYKDLYSHKIVVRKMNDFLNICFWLYFALITLIFIAQQFIPFKMYITVEPFNFIIAIAICLLNIIFRGIKLNQEVLSYYSLFASVVIISALFKQKDLTISLGFLMPMIVSSFYFDKRKTRATAFFSYFSLIVSFLLFNENSIIGNFTWAYFKSIYVDLIRITLRFSGAFFFIFIMENNFGKYFLSQQVLAAKLDEQQKKYEVVIKNSSDIVFQYFLKTDFYTANGAILTEYNGDKVEIPNFTSWLYTIPWVNSDFPDFVTSSLKSSANIGVELDLSYNLDGRKISLWFLYEGDFIWENDEPTSIVGRLINITDKKLKEEALLDKSRRDSSTGLYTLAYIKTIAEKYDNSNFEKTAIVINIKNVTDINKYYGYIYGDTIISNIADLISNNAPENALICRLKGSSFLIYITDSREVSVAEFLEDLGDKMDRLYIGENEISQLKYLFGVSTGNSTFEKLFLEAFENIYVKEKNKSKADGKELENIINLVEENTTSFITEKYDSDEMEKGHRFIASMLELIEKAKDLRSALMLTLSRIGNQFNMDRITIWEFDNKYNLKLAYEWAIID